MTQRWEIINQCTNKRVQICDTEELAQKLLNLHDKNHIVKEILFVEDKYLKFPT